MKKTQTQKAFALIALAAVLASSFGVAAAATKVGTGSITGSGTTSDIMWDDQFPGTASGSVTNIRIKARVNPALNMEISNEEIDLGVLVPGTAGSGSLNIEVGTNAKDGVSITARSQNGGLKHTTSTGGLFINDNAGGAAFQDEISGESYTWGSTPNTTDDSSSASFSASGLTTTEVNNNTAEHVVYTTNKGEQTQNVDDVNFAVSATATTETPAGDYEDFVTFTVTGNF